MLHKVRVNCLVLFAYVLRKQVEKSLVRSPDFMMDGGKFSTCACYGRRVHCELIKFLVKFGANQLRDLRLSRVARLFILLIVAFKGKGRACGFCVLDLAVC